MNEMELTREYLNLLKYIYSNDGLATTIKHELNATRKSLMIRLEGLLDIPGFPGSNEEERKQIKHLQEVERQYTKSALLETYKLVFGYGNPKKIADVKKKWEDAHRNSDGLLSKKNVDYRRRVQERNQRRAYALLNYHQR